METAQKSFILYGGEVKALDSPRPDVMEISGWASTKDLDLTNEVILPSAFAEHFDEYARKGRYWFNHDPNFVIGHVKQAHLEVDGFYIDRAVLPPTEFNKTYLFPLIREGALNEQSVQVRSLEAVWDAKAQIYYHTKVYVLECSIVSIACNPEAVITGFKRLMPSSDFYNANMDQLMKLQAQHLLKSADSLPKLYVIPNPLKDEGNVAKVGTVDMTTCKELHYWKNALEKTEDASDEVPAQERLHLLSKNGVCFFKVAKEGENGVELSWPDVAVSMGLALGAKGGVALTEEQRNYVFDSFAAIYKKLEKELPKIGDVPLDSVDKAFLCNTHLKDVQFANDELLHVEDAVFTSHFKSFKALLNKYKDGTRPEFMDALVKSVYLSTSIEVITWAEGADAQKDIEFVQSLLNLYRQYSEKAQQEYDIDSFAKFILAQKQDAKDLESLYESYLKCAGQGGLEEIIDFLKSKKSD